MMEVSLRGGADLTLSQAYRDITRPVVEAPDEDLYPGQAYLAGNQSNNAASASGTGARFVASQAANLGLARVRTEVSAVSKESGLRDGLSPAPSSVTTPRFPKIDIKPGRPTSTRHTPGSPTPEAAELQQVRNLVNS